MSYPPGNDDLPAMSERYDRANTSTTASISIRRQPPSTIFLEESFETEIVIEGHTIEEGTTFDVSALLVEDNPRNRALVRLVVLHNPSPLTGNTEGKLRFSLASVSDRSFVFERNQLYQIQLSVLCSAAATVQESPIDVIASVMTSKILVVLHKIQLSYLVDWDKIWYKDEGGRDKCLEILAGIYDHQRELLFEPVPLLLTLCYGSPTRPPIPVANQNILRIVAPESMSNKFVMDEIEGKVKIRFRVEDVSKNHQGQDFCLQVAVDSEGKENCIIAPAFTRLVTIRSKRNKRGRQASLTAATMLQTPPEIMDAVPKQRVAGQSSSQREVPSSTVHATVSSLYSTPFREAVQGVTEFINDVVSGLHPLQWQVVGYSQDVNGNPDYNRPYHNMQNPNALIDRVLSTYNERTRYQLELLQQSVEGTISYAPPRQLYSSNVQPMPQPSFDPRHQFMQSRYALPQQREFVQSMAMLPPFLPDIDSYQQPNVPAILRLDRERASLNSPRITVGQMPITAHPTAATARTTKEHHKGDKEVSATQQHANSETGANQTASEDMVEYVIAQDFKSVRTRKILGLPAYCSDKTLVGFYRRTGECGPFFFDPLDQEDFGPAEMEQATAFLEQALSTSKPPAKSMQELGSIQAMLDHVLVYEFQKGLEAESERGRKEPQSKLSVEKRKKSRESKMPR
jgi:hypothetical protein